MDSELKQYWAESHAIKFLPALSDHQLSEHISFLKLNVPETGNILCVGVGTGNWIRELQKQTQAKITVLDICQQALEGFNGLTNACELPSDYFDLAISLWVAPHMFTQELYEQMYQVIRSLKISGVFALQYNEPVDSLSMPEHHWVAKAGRISCDRNKFKEMVDRCSGVCEFVNEITATGNLAFLRTKMVAAHLRRA